MFDLRDPKIWTKTYLDELLRQPLHFLDQIPKFSGPAVYNLYYLGNFPLYLPIRNVITYSGKSNNAWNRLAKDHFGSLKSTENLDVTDFRAQFLSVEFSDCGYIEDELIRKFKPLWNNRKLLSGFGNHVVGQTRSTQRRSKWDTLHPGRCGSAYLESYDPDEITAEVEQYILNYPEWMKDW